MKPLKEQKTWKVLIGIIIGLAVVSFIVAMACYVSAERTQAKNSRTYREAADAGFDKEYSVCKKEEILSFDGVSYVRYSVYRDSFIDGGYYDHELLIAEDASCINETEDQTEGLVIYGKMGDHQIDPARYEVIEPYRIAVYQKPVDMWAVAAALVLVGIIELILIVAAAVYFIRYSAKVKTP